MGIVGTTREQWNFLLPDLSIKALFANRPIPMVLLFFLIVWTVCWLVLVTLYIVRYCVTKKHKDKIEYKELEVRSPILTIISAFGAELALTCQIFYILFSQENFPCFVSLYNLLLCIPLYFLPFVVRFGRYIATVNVAAEEVVNLKLGNMKIQEAREKFGDNIVSLFERKAKRMFTSFDTVWTSEGPYVAILGIAISVCLTVGNSFQASLLSGWENAYGCELRRLSFIFLIVLLSICFILMVAGVIYSRILVKKKGITVNQLDPYKIRYELISCFIVWLCFLIPYLIQMYYSEKMTRVGNQLNTFLMIIFIAVGFFTSVIWPLHLSFRQHEDERVISFNHVMDVFNFQPAEEILRDESINKNCSWVYGLAKDITELKKREQDPTCQTNIKTEVQNIYDKWINPDSEINAKNKTNIGGTTIKQLHEQLSQSGSNIVLDSIFKNVISELQKFYNSGELSTARERLNALNQDLL